MPKLNVVAGIIDKVADRIDDFTLDKAEKATLIQEINKAQLEVNKVEAGQSGLLSRWRAFLGWTISVAFGYHYIIQPFLLFILSAFGLVVILPEFDMSTMTTILLGMLGLGGMKSFDRMNRK
jgi:hypothetical protein|tara:strand:- start:29 stop:394 length:366 start_codon:yes stop_codon:yes gene_type:complete